MTLDWKKPEALGHKQRKPPMLGHDMLLTAPLGVVKDARSWSDCLAKVEVEARALVKRSAALDCV